MEVNLPTLSGFVQIRPPEELNFRECIIETRFQPPNTDQNWDFLPNIMGVLLNNNLEVEVDSVLLKTGELGIKAINRPKNINFSVNKMGELILISEEGDDIYRYQKGGDDNLYLIWTD